MRALLFLLVLASAAECFARQRYKYYLDPNRAEDILANLHLNRTPEQRWLTLLGPKRNSFYEVRPGDNLWDISSRTVGNPRLWSKLWEMNPALTNPHDLSVGQLLSFYRAGMDPSPVRVPMVKLVPNQPGAVNDLDSDEIINPQVRQQYRPHFLIVEDKDLLAKLTGAHDQGAWLHGSSDLFFEAKEGVTLSPRTLYSVVRFESHVSDIDLENSSALGDLVRLVGEVETEFTREGLTKAHLVRHSDTIRRGDWLMKVEPPISPTAVFNPPDGFTARVIKGQAEDAHYFVQGQIVLINKGKADGVREGFLFRVPEQLDAYANKDVGVDYKGEVQVISAGQWASIALILQNRSPLHVGDNLVAAQTFPDPPPPPRRQVHEIEID